ncbi:hypothetical protein [Celeribacter baekdonensis]|uniref:hypothetical protein n=1 Tax=Celeribacter baekdonensis TaxID=875171 RepID=UPI003A8D22B3
MQNNNIQDAQIYDALADRPLIAFILSEFWGTLAAVIVYAIFEFGSFLTVKITVQVGTVPSEQAIFLSSAFSWAAAIGATTTFVVILYYQLRILQKRLQRRLEDV